jgi:hypothetical protein
MANHKRKGPKITRSGCLLCKPHKIWGNRKGATKPKYRMEAEAL